MKIKFQGDLTELVDGINVFSEIFKFNAAINNSSYFISSNPNQDENTYNITVEINKHQYDSNINIKKSDEKVIIQYKEKIHFFRALGLLLEQLKENSNSGTENTSFEIMEKPQFTLNGAMFDVSQGNAVINVKNVKKIIQYMAVMGLNMLMLYTEDSYEIKDEPYFGYMRSKYTQDELKEIDDYAFIFGIEIIPCIQTLAHLIDALKWPCYRDIKEDDDTLLVGYDRSYEFIEKMIKTACAPFRSKRIHIGMDEAWKLGQGKYLLKNGYRRKFDIMNEHLARVLQITKKHDLKPMIWSDMYFRAASKNGEYYDMSSSIPQEVIDKAPGGVQLVYWDYYHDNEDFYIEWIKRHRAFGSDPVFAGGLWTWTGFTHNYGLTYKNTNAALSSCKREGVKEVFATIWGDDNTECNIYSNLIGLQLFAEHGYSESLDDEKLKKRFKFCTGVDYDDFTQIKYIDEVPGTKINNPDNNNVSKYLMWQDILLGLFDKNIEGLSLRNHYRELSKRLRICEERNEALGFLFKFMYKVSQVLEIKSELGIEILNAYQKKDKNILKDIVEEELPELRKRVKSLMDYHRDLWMQINKPAGWEILDLRYGALLARINTSSTRITEYLNGNIDIIEELEHERLPFFGVDGLVQCNTYNRIPSASRISITTFYG